MSEERALTVRQPQSMALDTMADLLSFGKVMVESGMFPDVKSQAQAVVKVVAGRELGLPPLYSLRKIYVINGQVTLSADAMAHLIKRSGEYDYQVLKLDDAECSIQFTHHGKACGPPSTFTMDDAKAAGLTTGNWAKFKRNMLFARALSNGARWYCPHVIGGVYTPDEMGGTAEYESEMETIRDARPVAVDMSTGEIVETVAQPSTATNGAKGDDPVKAFIATFQANVKRLGKVKAIPPEERYGRVKAITDAFLDIANMDTDKLRDALVLLTGEARVADASDGQIQVLENVIAAGKQAMILAVAESVEA